MFCMARSRGDGFGMFPVDESSSFDDVSEEVETSEPLPSFLSRFGELEDHGERCLS